MDVNLQRITTEYVDLEDRLRLVGEVNCGQPVVLWLSQRMVRVLMPPFFKWLEQSMGHNAHAELMQSFAQQAAQAALQPQPSVLAAADAHAWLVQSVDISQSQQAIALRFRDGGENAASLTLEPMPMRQWLGIVHTLCNRAGWQLGVWPDWLMDATADVERSKVALH
jgi:hypothetical protein